MNDINETISRVLSDPDMMEQIKNLSGMFSKPQTDIPPPAPPPPAPSAELLPAVMRFMPILTAYREDDDAVRLLRAVMPYLSPQRRERAEQAISLLRIIRIIPMIKELSSKGAIL